MLAALNHKRIATIYGLEEAGPVLALAMELVEGPAVAERLASGPIDLRETLTLARDMAEDIAGVAAGARRGRGLRRSRK